MISLHTDYEIHEKQRINQSRIPAQPERSCKDPEVRFRIPRDNGARGVLERRQALLDHGKKIHWISKNEYPVSAVQGNIENYIGNVSVPLGIAGPLLIKGDHAQGQFMVPMATSEGTLVASYSRGMAIIRESGGCFAKIHEEGMQRAPVFRFKNLKATALFSTWIREVFPQLKEVAGKTTSHGCLTEIDIYEFGRLVVLRLVFHTQDAAGQNMVNLASYEICRFISKACPHWNEIDTFHLASGFCSDKKYSSMNILKTRGKKVTAEAMIPEELIKKTLRSTPEKIRSLYLDGTLTNIYAGCAGNGLHSANGIAAIFTACGQDIANIAESHGGFLDVRLEGKDLYLSVTLPSLIVGTVGGGTGLPAQSECLDIMECKGSGKSGKFAEIIAGAALAGELSLMGAITSMEWVQAHETMGRNRE